MSHIVTVTTQVRDLEAVATACRNLLWQAPRLGTHRLFARTMSGLAVFPPAWRYPVVCDLVSGNMHYDNFGGRWGSETELDRFKQRYAVEKATMEARRLGHAVFEQPLEDGTIKLTIHAGVNA